MMKRETDTSLSEITSDTKSTFTDAVLVSDTAPPTKGIMLEAAKTIGED